MELIRGLHNLRPRHRACVATIGAFDGIHLGHQAVLKQLVLKAKELAVPSCIIVFEPLPREYFAPYESPPRLTSFRERWMQLKACGIDRVLRVRFDQALSEVSAEDFIEQVFVKGLGIHYIVVGDDLRFGHDRQGDFSLLRRVGEKHGFDVMATSTLCLSDSRVSSTRLRRALQNADFVLAESLLGRAYYICGKVVVGQQLGRTLGFPTANIQLRRFRAALSGVYAVEVKGLGDTLLPAVANCGTRPTVNGITAILEVHLLDFDADIYGHTIQVIFRKKLRDEKKFADLEELKASIAMDVETSRAYFGLTSNS